MEQVEASGAHWKREEVLALLSVWKEEDIFRDVQSVSEKKKPVYGVIAERLAGLGFNNAAYSAYSARAGESGQLGVNLSGMPHAQYDHKADRNRLAIICDAIFWPVWTQPKKTGVWIAIQIAIFFVVETAL